jgi:hypothetical protein
MQFAMNANETLTIPFYNKTGYNCTIYWGDGSPISTITGYDDPDRVHTYAVSGIYNVSISGTCKGIYFNNSGNNLNLTKIIQWGNVGFTTFENAFFGCSNLTELPEGSITGADAVSFKGFYFTFNGCSGLTSIPSGLFDHNTLVSDWGFGGTFWGCTGLTSIPSGLFANNILVSYRGFYCTFYDCTGLTSIPSGLFDHNTLVSVSGFYCTFNGCTGLTSIPSRLFDHNTLASYEGFCSTFAFCSGLTSIPSGLFDNNVNCNDWSYCFYDCTALGGDAPELWIKYPTANGGGCFTNCTGLDNYEDIPASWGGPGLGSPLQQKEKAAFLSGVSSMQGTNNRVQLASKLKVYPNPAKSVLTIESPFENYNTSLYDYTGRCVINQPSCGKESLNVGQLRKGIYLLVVESEGKQETMKITLE